MIWEPLGSRGRIENDRPHIRVAADCGKRGHADMDGVRTKKMAAGNCCLEDSPNVAFAHGVSAVCPHAARCRGICRCCWRDRVTRNGVVHGAFHDPEQMSGITLAKTVDHLLHHVLAAVTEYEAAEANLSKAHASGKWEVEATIARRKAAELAIAIDGLADRAQHELRVPLDNIRADVSGLCFWPGGNQVRKQAFERVHGVANAYKHSELTKKTHVIASFDDVLAVGLGYGVDGFGVGKFNGVEVLVKDKSGQMRKFLGDVPAVLNGWFHYLRDKGAVLPSQTCRICGVDVTIG